MSDLSIYWKNLSRSSTVRSLICHYGEDGADGLRRSHTECTQDDYNALIVRYEA